MRRQEGIDTQRIKGAKEEAKGSKKGTHEEASNQEEESGKASRRKRSQKDKVIHPYGRGKGKKP